MEVLQESRINCLRPRHERDCFNVDLWTCVTRCRRWKRMSDFGYTGTCLLCSQRGLKWERTSVAAMKALPLYACRCLPLCLSSHFIVFLYASHYPSLYSPFPQMDCTPPLPALLFSLSLLQLIAASADYFIQCGPLRASSPGFGRALISHVNIPFIGLNITQHLPPSQRPPGSPCPVRTADYWEG